MILTSCQDEEDNSNPNTIIGEWRCEENHPSYGLQNYNVDIQEDLADSTKINIYNFLGLNTSIDGDYYADGKVSGNSLSILPKSIDGHFVSGSGTISSNYKTIEYRELVPILVEAIKELEQRIIVLENK